MRRFARLNDDGHLTARNVRIADLECPETVIVAVFVWRDEIDADFYCFAFYHFTDGNTVSAADLRGHFDQLGILGPRAGPTVS